MKCKSIKKLRWTFGNHEPLSMYRRIGRKSTGAIQGSALWLDKWHDWYDSEESAKIISELGFNVIHCRFYKGMGWEFEKEDFQKVKKFVGNCHKYNIRVLAYVQFSTLYYEILQSEVPQVRAWASIDYSGNIQTYHGGEYYRWMPCITKRPFIDYLKNVIKIGLSECPFDGIMLDNAHSYICYCPDCQKGFREFLSNNHLAKKMTALPNFDNIQIPPIDEEDDIKDPLRLLYMDYRAAKCKEVFKELYEHVKSVSPKAIVSGNFGNIRRYSLSRFFGLDCFELKDCFDIIISQSGNSPSMNGSACINRIREHKLAESLNIDILALSDHDGGLNLEGTNTILLNLAENFAFDSIPVERTIMAPDRHEMVNRSRIELNKKIITSFFDFTRRDSELFGTENYCPVRILYSKESVNYSRKSSREILNFEEIMMRKHIPYGLLATSADRPLEIPQDCELLIIPEQYCLSDAQFETIESWACQKRKLLLTPNAGSCNEHYCEREVYLTEKLLNHANVHILPASSQTNIISDDWTIKLKAPENMQEIGELVKSLINLPFTIKAPESVQINVKSAAGRLTLHFLNYDLSTNQEVIIFTPHKNLFELYCPFENKLKNTDNNDRFSFMMEKPYSMLILK